MLDQDKKLELENRARDIREDIVTMIGCLLYTSRCV